MRIIAGKWRGKKLAQIGEGDAAAHLRPTSDRVRESLFNVITSGKYGAPLPDAIVLDLFAGTGALGLEALSRGAAQVIFVDDGTTARALLRENISLCSAQGQSKVFRRDARELGEARHSPASLVFLDPPYGKGLGEKALASAIARGWLSPGALIVWEENAPPVLPEGAMLLDQRKYGETTITLARAP